MEQTAVPLAVAFVATVEDSVGVASAFLAAVVGGSAVVVGGSAETVVVEGPAASSVAFFDKTLALAVAVGRLPALVRPAVVTPVTAVEGPKVEPEGPRSLVVVPWTPRPSVQTY